MSYISWPFEREEGFCFVLFCFASAVILAPLLHQVHLESNNFIYAFGKQNQIVTFCSFNPLFVCQISVFPFSSLICYEYPNLYYYSLLSTNVERFVPSSSFGGGPKNWQNISCLLAWSGLTWFLFWNVKFAIFMWI